MKNDKGEMIKGTGRYPLSSSGRKRCGLAGAGRIFHGIRTKGSVPFPFLEPQGKPLSPAMGYAPVPLTNPDRRGDPNRYKITARADCPAG